MLWRTGHPLLPSFAPHRQALKEQKQHKPSQKVMQRHLRLREIRGLGETSVNMGTTFSIPRLARTVAMKRSCVALPFVKPYRKGSRCLVSLILAYV